MHRVNDEGRHQHLLGVVVWLQMHHTYRLFALKCPEVLSLTGLNVLHATL
mgnify:CR=1 FL=1